MELAQHIVKRVFLDPSKAEENLKNAAIEYVRAIEAKQSQERPSPFVRRM